MLLKKNNMIVILVIVFFINFQLVGFALPIDKNNSKEIIYTSEKIPDPLKRDSEIIETQIIMEQQKRDPTTAAVLSLLFPGIGQIYTGDTTRGFIVIVGGIGVLIFTTFFAIILDVTGNTFARWMSIIIGGGGYFTYLSWAATDAYYQAELLNQNIDCNMKNAKNLELHFTLFKF